MKHKLCIALTILPVCIICLFLATKNAANHTFTRIEDQTTLYSEGSHIVLFGRQTCRSCQVAMDYISDSLKKEKICVLYYDTDKFRNDATFEQVLEDFDVVEVPTLCLVQDGTCITSVSLITDDGQLDKSVIEEFFESLKEA